MPDSACTSSAFSRIVATRSSVSVDAGPVVGVTCAIVRSPASFCTAGATAATPGISPRP